MSNSKWSMIRNTALTFVVAAGVSQATVSTVGGNVQIVNLLNSAAQAGLDLTSDGSDVEIANFTISNNTEEFTLNFVFANGGVFENASVAGQSVAMTQVRLVPNGGTLGTGITALIPAGVCAAATPVIAANCGDISAQVLTAVANSTITWEPDPQSTPTIGYIISMQADWTAATSVLAGLYTETITATLTAVL